MLLARTEALPADQVLTLPLPAGPEAGPLARAAVRRRLRAWSVDEETAFTAELVANAVRYGAPPFRPRLIRDRSPTCEVSDTSPSSPHAKHARTIDESGRGTQPCELPVTFATQGSYLRGSHLSC
ncbi:ATP-binding protein [Streptomyces puniciscabiei]|uniref:ATP-binding protein n=1 Tax=Streptomyces puniciscabiei TaxID=164348 RepID=UPI001F28E549|nr:ATP-binding protein [Streptomyces puniciscabiei]